MTTSELATIVTPPAVVITTLVASPASVVLRVPLTTPPWLTVTPAVSPIVGDISQF